MEFANEKQSKKMGDVFLGLSLVILIVLIFSLNIYAHEKHCWGPGIPIHDILCDSNNPEWCCISWSESPDSDASEVQVDGCCK